MTTTVNHTFRVAFQGGFRRDTDADSCTVSCQLLTAGVPSGVDLVLVTAGSVTAAPMTQWHPGLFSFTSENSPLTRGKQYRATYTPVLGGVSQTAQTQDFYAYSDATSGGNLAGYHSYTTAQLRNIVRRALGLQEKTASIDGQEPGSANSLDIVNDAFGRVWHEHRWQYQLGEPTYGELITDQTRYQLPEDFMELATIIRPADTTHRWEVRPLEWIRSQRERGQTNPVNCTYYAVVSDPPDDVTERPRYALEIFPTPAGFLQSGYLLEYYRECPKVTSDSDVPPFPLGFFPILKQAVRLEAFEQENDPRAAGEAGKYERMLAPAKNTDSRHMPTNLGSMVQRGWDDDDNLDSHHDAMGEVGD